MAIAAPQPVLEVLVSELSIAPPLTALCAGYEAEDWRADQLAANLFEWLPEFALSWTERERFADTTAVALLRRAAQVVYGTDKYSRRGEFGELLLHAVVRPFCQLAPQETRVSRGYALQLSRRAQHGAHSRGIPLLAVARGHAVRIEPVGDMRE
jgi:hypothetical protein